ncbi:MAG: PIN domain-containing protein [Saprospiraceae bacterium]|nr:PIN domain-containing protein [Lewinella sp.]MCB0689283.1 PIN domain-containing protein [Saprospiraceae bacterium]
MIKVFIDTNIVLDLLAKREPFYEDAAKIFSLADRGKMRLYVSSLTIANSNYVLSRLQSAKEARAVLIKFKILVEILALNSKIIELALSDDSFKDFEDGLQYYTGLENEVDLLITRNLKDFKSSKIPVMTASQYLKRFVST